MRRASVRTIILQQLSHHHVVSAATILEYFRLQGMTVNKTSVYRALEKLSADGLITAQNITPGEVVYELRHEHHDHFVCTQCGSITSISCSAKNMELPTNFRPDHHQMTVFGHCAKCG